MGHIARAALDFPPPKLQWRHSYPCQREINLYFIVITDDKSYEACERGLLISWYELQLLVTVCASHELKRHCSQPFFFFLRHVNDILSGTLAKHFTLEALCQCEYINYQYTVEQLHRMEGFLTYLSTGSIRVFASWWYKDFSQSCREVANTKQATVLWLEKHSCDRFMRNLNCSSLNKAAFYQQPSKP